MCIIKFIKNKRQLKRIERLIMATKQEVLDAIAAETAQVSAKIAELNATIQALQDQINSGNSADNDEIKAAVENILP